MSEKDIVEEARALVTKCAPSGKITNGADAYLFDMQGPRLLRALADEVARLRGVIERTLDENRHLADGDDCTLIDLKRSINWKDPNEQLNP